MAYRVIKHFTDLQDNGFAYSEDDIYPREGLSVLPSRIKELSTRHNRRGEPLIVEVPDEPVEAPKRRAKTTDKAEE